MSTHHVVIGAGDWFADNLERVGIYNRNYIGMFEKRYDSKDPWTLAAQSAELSGKRFATQQAAATFVREHLANAEAQVSE